MGHPVVLVFLALAQPPAWPTEAITLANGGKLSGLVVEENPAFVKFTWVRRLPGRPTVTLTSVYRRAEVTDIKRLPDADRAVLREKLDELTATAAGERGRIDSTELVVADWPGRPGGAKRYTGDQFVLVSAAPDEVTRRAAVGLEQIYTAYSRFFPPRGRAGRPTSILLGNDLAAVRDVLGPAAVLNPAVFDATNNRIVCGTDLGPLGADLATARLQTAQQLAGLDKYEAEVQKLYKGAERDRHLSSAAELRKKVWAAERANAEAFDKATRSLFALLYHETFHAYAAAFAFPPRSAGGPGELPRWLNEGLAQIFETAVLEGSELRVGHPDRERLLRVQELLKATPGPVPVADLIRAGPDAFLAAHADRKAAADRTYLTSWAVAYYLTFERRAVGTPAFDEYLSAAAADPRKAFEALVEQDAAGFDRDWRAHLTKLLPSGSVKN